MSDGDQVYADLCLVADLLDEAKVPFLLIYGTLLGAAREGDVIPWDYDFDLLILPRDMKRILGLSSRGVTFAPHMRTAEYLALNPGGVQKFWTGHLVCLKDGRRLGDLYCPRVFRDGVLRFVDIRTGVYWTPRSSFPHFFVQHLTTLEIRGRPFRAMAHYDRFLEGVYGADWRTPYKASLQGGEPRPGFTIHGDRYEPKLHSEIAWARSLGWDQSRYATQPQWPFAIAAAGPIGPTERTVDNSESLWWRNFQELMRFY